MTVRGQRGLAAARLAHQAQGLALVQGERHVVDGGELLLGPAQDGVEHRVLEGEALAELAHLEQGPGLLRRLGVGFFGVDAQVVDLEQHIVFHGLLGH